jgi:excisionase family DNA binding protein
MFEQYPDMLTVMQVAKALSIGRNKAYELVNNNIIGSIQIGRKYLVPKSWLIDYIETSRYNKSA